MKRRHPTTFGECLLFKKVTFVFQELVCVLYSTDTNHIHVILSVGSSCLIPFSGRTMLTSCIAELLGIP